MAIGLSGKVIMHMADQVRAITADETKDPMAKLLALNELVGKAPRFEVYQHEICMAFNGAVTQVAKILEQQQQQIAALQGQPGPAAQPGG